MSKPIWKEYAISCPRQPESIFSPLDKGSLLFLSPKQHCGVPCIFK